MQEEVVSGELRQNPAAAFERIPLPDRAEIETNRRVLEENRAFRRIELDAIETALPLRRAAGRVKSPSGSALVFLTKCEKSKEFGVDAHRNASRRPVEAGDLACGIEPRKEALDPIDLGEEGFGQTNRLALPAMGDCDLKKSRHGPVMESADFDHGG